MCLIITYFIEIILQGSVEVIYSRKHKIIIIFECLVYLIITYFIEIIVQRSMEMTYSWKTENIISRLMELIIFADINPSHYEMLLSYSTFCLQNKHNHRLSTKVFSFVMKTRLNVVNNGSKWRHSNSDDTAVRSVKANE